jgi:hypothetical protein
VCLPLLYKIPNVILQPSELAERSVDRSVQVHERSFQGRIFAELTGLDLMLQLLERYPKIGYAVRHSTRSFGIIPIIAFAIIASDTT